MALVPQLHRSPKNHSPKYVKMLEMKQIAFEFQANHDKTR